MWPIRFKFRPNQRLFYQLKTGTDFYSLNFKSPQISAAHVIENIALHNEETNQLKRGTKAKSIGVTKVGAIVYG